MLSTFRLMQMFWARQGRLGRPSLMFSRIGVLNAFFTSMIFNLEWVYWDRTPPKSRKICILERKNLHGPSNQTALKHMPPSAHLLPWVKQAAETEPLVFGNNSKRSGDVNEDSIFRAPRESAWVHYWEPGKRFWWGGHRQCRSTYRPVCGHDVAASHWRHLIRQYLQKRGRFTHRGLRT